MGVAKLLFIERRDADIGRITCETASADVSLVTIHGESTLSRQWMRIINFINRECGFINRA